MATVIDPTQVIGHKVLDAQGHKIGQAEEVYLDDSTGMPQWVTVKGGLFGGKEHFAPLGGASIVEDEVRLACAKAQVDSAPDLETGRHLSVEEEQELYRHYGLGRREVSAADRAAAGNGDSRLGDAGKAGRADTAVGMPLAAAGTATAGTMAAGTATGTGTAGATGRHAVGKDRAAGRDQDDAVMTRFEERLHVRTERVESGHARLHKYVTTERVQRVVPLTHQEVRIEREAIPEGERRTGPGAGELTEAEQDVLLYEERTVVTKEAVPVERVRMHVDDVTEDVTVLEDVRTEHIDLEGDTRPPTEGRLHK
jgi:uncharacterized protein (TIGR02271 family)